MDDPSLADAVRRGMPEAYWTWPEIGPRGGVFGEALLRVCPTCMVAIVNENTVMQGHVEYHRAHGH